MIRKLVFLAVVLTANVVLMSADSGDANGQIFRRWANSSRNSYNQRYAQPQAAQYQRGYENVAQPRTYANQYQAQPKPQSNCGCQQGQARTAGQQHSQQAAYNAPSKRDQTIQRTSYLATGKGQQVDIARQRQPNRFVEPQPSTVNGTLSPVRPVAAVKPIATQPSIQPATVMQQGSVVTLEPAVAQQNTSSPTVGESSGLSLTSPIGTTTASPIEAQQEVVAPQESFSVLELTE